MNVPFLQTATFTGLVSTDEYYTSQEWSQAYDVSQNVFTNVQSNSGDWNYAYNVATFYSQNSAILIEQTTFSELTSLKANNQLKPGQYYQINDFQLMWWNIDSTNTTLLSSGVIEPLLVLALSSNSISHEAFSTFHPEDIVYYDIDARTSTTWNKGLSNIPNFKGWIYRRIDRLNNIDICWDWRYITNNCCKYDLDPVPLYDINTTYNKRSVVKTISNKLYISIRDSNLSNPVNDDKWWRPATENNDDSLYYYPTTEEPLLRLNYLESTVLFSLTPILSSRTGFPTFCVNNLTPMQTDIIAQGIKNIKIDDGSYNIIFVSNTSSPNTLKNVKIGSESYNNIFVLTGQNRIEFFETGKGFNGNNIQARRVSNVKIGDDCARNFFSIFGLNLTIKDNFWSNHIRGFGRSYDNIIGNGCMRNFFSGFYSSIMGNQMFDNVFIYPIYFNVFGEAFQYNIVNTLYSCTFGNNCKYNNLGSFFSYNKLGENFYNNIIGDNCNNNIIANNFTNNSIGDFFANNIIANEFYSNTIGNNFTFNIINNSFANNVIESFFTKTNVNNEIQNINFTGATHVYNSYDKTIFNNFDLNARLSYFNSNDQLVVTDPTA